MDDWKQLLAKAKDALAQEDYRVALEIAKEFIGQKDYGLALGVYDQVIRQCPVSVNAFLEAGYCWFCKGQPEKALETVLHVKSLLDSPGMAVSNVGPGIFISEGKVLVKSADGRLSPLKANVKDDLARLGMDRMQSGDVYGCLVCLKLCAFLDPSDFRFPATIGSTSLELYYQNDGEDGVKALLIEEAEAALEKALEMKPEDFISIATMGAFKYLRGDLVSAEELSLKALEINPSSRTARSTLDKLKG